MTRFRLVGRARWWWKAVLAAVTSLAAVVGLRRLQASAARARRIPFCPLTARWYVGEDYFDRNDIPTTDDVSGDVDDMAAYARPDFDPAQLHPAVRRFYEQTAAYALVYDVTWHPGFRLGAAFAGRITRRIQQLNLPGPREPTPRPLDSYLLNIDETADPRPGTRAWIRTDPATDDAVFVAVFAEHRRDDVTYLNIGMPLPWSNLSTVLHLETLDIRGDGAGLTLTTTTDTGDEGIYLVTPAGPAALPIEHTYRVWPADAPGAPPDVSGGEATVVATHRMWIYSREFLTIEYACVPESASRARTC